MEGGAALHIERFPSMMREHENIAMIRRIVTPPTFPIVIRPCSADRAEHVPPDNPSTDIFKTPSGELVVNASLRRLMGRTDGLVHF
jgi:hypothetical protein